LPCYLGKEVLNAIQTKKATRLLVDNSLVKGTFTDATYWVTGTFFPKAIQAGINTVASIPSPDVFGKFAGTQVLNKVQGLAMQRFINKAEALQWLQSL
jgi:hypothetical protein